MVKLFVGNLSFDTQSEELRDIFEKYGQVNECDVLKNYGFVHMSDDDGATAAIDNLQGYSHRGLKMRIEKSTTVKRSGGRGDGRDRGGRGGGFSRGGGRGRGGPPGGQSSYGGGRDRYDPYGRPPAPAPYSRDPYYSRESPDSYYRDRYAPYPERLPPHPADRYSPYERPAPPPYRDYDRHSAARPEASYYERRGRPDCESRLNGYPDADRYPSEKPSNSRPFHEQHSSRPYYEQHRPAY